MMYGTLSSFGNYDECLDIEAMDDDDDTTPKFYGQYCAINYAPYTPLNYSAEYLDHEMKKSRIISKVVHQQNFTATHVSIGLKVGRWMTAISD